MDASVWPHPFSGLTSSTSIFPLLPTFPLTHRCSVSREGTQHSQADININTKKRQGPRMRNMCAFSPVRVFFEYVIASPTKQSPVPQNRNRFPAERGISLLAMTGAATCTRVAGCLPESQGVE